jgi:WhiB family redox-sensing transcriptional regulator
MKRDWMQRAACQGFPSPDWFFLGEWHDEAGMPERARAALAICRGCPVQQECLQYALETNTRTGIWGGRIFGARGAA